MDARNTPLNVSVLGVDDRLRTTLRMFFQGPCKSNVVMAGTGDAEACIIDMDGLNAETILSENILIIDTLGKEVLKLKAGNNLQIDTTLLAKGIYYVKATSFNETLKIIKI